MTRVFLICLAMQMGVAIGNGQQEKQAEARKPSSQIGRVSDGIVSFQKSTDILSVRIGRYRPTTLFVEAEGAVGFPVSEDAVEDLDTMGAGQGTAQQMIVDIAVHFPQDLRTVKVTKKTLQLVFAQPIKGELPWMKFQERTIEILKKFYQDVQVKAQYDGVSLDRQPKATGKWRNQPLPQFHPTPAYRRLDPTKVPKRGASASLPAIIL